MGKTTWASFSNLTMNLNERWSTTSSAWCPPGIRRDKPCQLSHQTSFTQMFCAAVPGRTFAPTQLQRILAQPCRQGVEPGWAFLLRCIQESALCTGNKAYWVKGQGGSRSLTAGEQRRLATAGETPSGLLQCLPLDVTQSTALTSLENMPVTAGLTEICPSSIMF